MRLVLDVMGGDYAPDEMLAGAIAWKAQHDDLGELILVGDENIITAKLTELQADPGLFTIVHASEVIGMEESPALAIRKKKEASIVVANKLLKEGRADALVSCGSTGAQMASAVFILGRLPKIERPPLVGLIPGENPTLLVDIGANIDCSAEQLLQFALVGRIYMQHIKKVANPRVGILNNGTEESKGNSVVQNAYLLFKEKKDLNFVGNVEGRDIFTDVADVLVCDGFVGNIVLKSLEGVIEMFAVQSMKEFGKIPSFLKTLDYTAVGGAPLLGVDGVSIVCHGSSKSESVVSALKSAHLCVSKNLIALQKEALTV